MKGKFKNDSIFSFVMQLLLVPELARAQVQDYIQFRQTNKISRREIRRGDSTHQGLVGRVNDILQQAHFIERGGKKVAEQVVSNILEQLGYKRHEYRYGSSVAVYWSLEPA